MTRLAILPDLAVEETWLWATDVMETRNGTEQRFSLQPAPSITQTLGFNPVDQPQRVDFWFGLSDDLGQASIYPLFGWGARITASAISTATIINAATPQMALNEDDYVFLVNPKTEEVIQRQASAVTATSITLTAQLGQAIDTDWFVYKGMQALAGNGNEISFGTVAGEVSLPLQSLEPPYVQRTNASASLTNFNSLPVLEKTILGGVQENVELVRDLTDFGLGRAQVFTRRNSVRINRRRVSFLIDRYTIADVDYWRLFLDTVRGRWKAFLLNTQLDDMPLGATLGQNATTLQVDRSGFGTNFLDHAAFENFEIHYSDGTSSRHTATSVSGTTVTFAPATPNDPKVANVERISYLLKARMADRLTWRHFPRKSRLTFDMTTTDSG